MDKPRFYSVTSIDILPENRDVNGIYHLRTADGFKVYRVSNTPSRDFIELKGEANNEDTVLILEDEAPVGVVVGPGIKTVLIASGSGSVVGLPPASENKGRVITLMHNHNSLNYIYSIKPKISTIRGSTVGIETLKSIRHSNANEPVLVSAISDGANWYALETRY